MTIFLKNKDLNITLFYCEIFDGIVYLKTRKAVIKKKRKYIK